MRSIAIYQNNSDYVNYSRGLGLADAPSPATSPERDLCRRADPAHPLHRWPGRAEPCHQLRVLLSGVGSVLFDAIQRSTPDGAGGDLVVAIAVLVANPSSRSRTARRSAMRARPPLATVRAAMRRFTPRLSFYAVLVIRSCCWLVGPLIVLYTVDPFAEVDSLCDPPSADARPPGRRPAGMTCSPI